MGCGGFGSRPGKRVGSFCLTCVRNPDIVTYGRGSGGFGHPRHDAFVLRHVGDAFDGSDSVRNGNRKVIGCQFGFREFSLDFLPDVLVARRR